MDQPRIEVQLNGPYLVSGSVPLSRRRMVRSEHDEPIIWQTTARLKDRDTFALCRCGGSSHKPFCDGTHQNNGFDGSETAPTNSYDERARTYPTTQVIVRDDRSICEHAGFCGNRLTDVWKMVRGPAAEDSVVRAQMLAMIERCPSGALTYRLEGEDQGHGDHQGDDQGHDQDNDQDVEPLLPAAVAVVADGPYFVTGGLPVARSDGQPFEARNRVTLCRCGASANKPLCDGSHQKIGFHDS